jgi:Transposase DDE domain
VGAPVRSCFVACRTLDRAPDLVRTGEHRLDLLALDRIVGVERETQDAEAVLGAALPRRLPVGTSRPLMFRRHRHNLIVRQRSDSEPRRMTVARLLALASMPRHELDVIVERIERIERIEGIERIERIGRIGRPGRIGRSTPKLLQRRRGRPWSCSLRRRILITCVALRTNLTFRELATCTAIALSTAHRIVAALTPRLANLLDSPPRDRRVLWVVDGTLIPTRDHTYAARSKNYRYSCNAQILIRQRDLHVIATAAGGFGNRNDPMHYRGSRIEPLCRTHRRVLADGGYRGIAELVTPVFRGRRTSATLRGVGTAVAEPVSSTRSEGSRRGASFATIAGEAAISTTRSAPSRSFTTCD